MGKPKSPSALATGGLKMGSRESTICLIDVNAMFASCAVLADPSLGGTPLVVAIDPDDRRSIVLTASYEARAFGVRTAMPLDRALALCTELKVARPDHQFYRQTQRAMGEVLKRYTPVVEWVSIDEAFLDLRGCPILSQGVEGAAAEMRRAVRADVGLPVSIGISSTRFLAKMASQLAKHAASGVFLLRPEAVPETLYPLPIEEFHGIGPKTASRLAAFSITTIGDLAGTPGRRVVQLIGQLGASFQAELRGEGAALVETNEAGAKSISHELTFARDIASPLELHPVLLALSDQVASRLRRSGLAGRQVALTIRDRTFVSHGRQVTGEEALFLTEPIFARVLTLLGRMPASAFPCRLAGVAVAGLAPVPPQAVTLFPDAHQNRRALAGALDQLRQRYGDDAVLWASTLGSPGQELYDTRRHGSSFRTRQLPPDPPPSVVKPIRSSDDRRPRRP